MPGSKASNSGSKHTNTCFKEGAKGPAAKKNRTGEATKEKNKMEESKEAVEEEYYDFLDDDDSPVKVEDDGPGLELAISPAAAAMTSPTKSKKVYIVIHVVLGVGLFITLQKGEEMNVYSEKYMKEISAKQVAVYGYDEYASKIAVMPQILDRFDDGVRQEYQGKDGYSYSRRCIHSAVKAHPVKDKAKLLVVATKLASFFNNHPDRPLSRYPESNKIHVDENISIHPRMNYTVSDLCGFGGAITVIKFHHPEIVIDRKFARSYPDLMKKFFKPGSLSVDEVRHIGASRKYANPKAIEELMTLQNGGESATAANIPGSPP